MSKAKKPAAKKAAVLGGEDRVDRDLEEVKRINREQREQEMEDRVVHRRSIRGVSEDGDGEGPEIVFVGRSGDATIEIDGNVIRLDRDGVGDLYRVASAMVQAVGV